MRRLLALSLLPCAALAGDLESLLHAAERFDASYAAAQSTWEASQEPLPQARAALYPSLKLTAKSDRNRYEAGTTQTTYNSHGYTLSLSQPLFNRALSAGYRQASTLVEKGDLELRQAQQALVLRVAVAWFDLGRAQAALTALEAQHKTVEAQLKQARLAFEVGVATITDTHEARARLDLIAAQRIAAENDLNSKRAALARIVGNIPTATPKAARHLPPPEGDEAAWRARAREDALAVRLAQQAERAAQETQHIKRAGFWPTVDLNASVTENNGALSSSGSTTDIRTGRIGVDLTWQLFQGGATVSQVREATANRAASTHRLEDARRAAEQEAFDAWLGLISGQQRIAALEAALQSAEAQLKSTQLGLEVGVRTRVDLLNADQQLHQTQRDLATARFDRMLARLKLEAAVGDLNGSDLTQLDTLTR